MLTRINPAQSEWRALCKRPQRNRQEIEATLATIFTLVQKSGDAAIMSLTEQYDGIMLKKMLVKIGDAEQEGRVLSNKLREAIDVAYDNIREFHKQSNVLKSSKITTSSGVTCWRESRPIESVGLYVPGGSAPLVSTMLMLGVPAQLAGCRNTVVCTPPSKDGSINSAIRYAAAKCGIDTLYVVGGAQAIAAMTLGTESVPKVDKLFGPGNQFVTAAKAYSDRYGVSKDMPAGPSEVLVIADETANPAFVAADLLSQAEHGPDSQVVLLCTSRSIQKRVETEIEKQLRTLPRKEVASSSLKKSLNLYFGSLDQAFDFANTYAPEHLLLQIKDAERSCARVSNAGSVFVGSYAPESAGDYASGTNHTLPTGGWSKSCSGLAVSDFQHIVTFQNISKEGIAELSKSIIPLAQAEGLFAHERAVSIRLNTL